MPKIYRVIIMPLAEQDVRDIVEHVGRDSAAHAQRLAIRIVDRALSLSRMPTRCAVSAKRFPIPVRVLVVGAYKIYYAVFADTVAVVRVWHSARRPPRAADLV